MIQRFVNILKCIHNQRFGALSILLVNHVHFQYLKTLPPGHVILAVEQLLIVSEEDVVVRVEKLSRHRLVLSDQVLNYTN